MLFQLDSLHNITTFKKRKFSQLLVKINGGNGLVLQLVQSLTQVILILALHRK